MPLKKKPVTGMKDILPREMEIRNYVMNLIKETYGMFGFVNIETPCVEHIENLSSKQGGDNEKLIFKIMKRGEKLKLETAQSDADLVDGGLRYDLTVPLSRYYSNNANELPSPFKALQMGNVWRADRPQRGRYRQFMVGMLDFQGFTIRINDRKILKAMAAYSGFPEEAYDEVFIILDKMDKIGLEGVEEELVKAGYEREKAEKYLELYREVTPDLAGIRYLKEKLTGFLDPKCAEDLETIITSVEAVKTADFKLVFDPTLVRGMSYYTGPIFEISIDGFGGSVGGGGRYDEMIGRFTGQNTPACGFSVGFERIVMLLLEKDYQIPSRKEKKAFLIEKGIAGDALIKVFEEAKAERATGVQVNVVQMKKNRKFQVEQLEKEGYTEIRSFYVEK